MKKILTVLFILIVFLIGLIFYWNSTNKRTSGIEIIISHKIYYLKDLNKYKPEQISTCKGELTGYNVKSILNSLSLSNNDFAVIDFISKDGGKISIHQKELDDLYLTIQTQNNQNYFRLVIPSDEFNQRWLKYVTKIKLKK